MTAMTPYDEIPTELRDELAAAGLDPRQVYDAVVLAIREDLPEPGDVDATSVATIPADATGIGVFAARQEGVIAGLGVAALVFHYVLGDQVKVTERIPDGTPVAPGDVVVTDGQNQLKPGSKVAPRGGPASAPAGSGPAAPGAPGAPASAGSAPAGGSSAAPPVPAARLFHHSHLGAIAAGYRRSRWL